MERIKLVLGSTALLCLAAYALGPQDLKTPVVKQPERLFHGDLVNARSVQQGDSFWQRANAEIAPSSDEKHASVAKLDKKLQRSVIERGITETNGGTHIYLTFDDGPHPNFTPKLLKVLKDAKVKATFFIVGFMAEKHPELIKAIAKDGHEVANHTFSHVNLSKLPLELVMTEYRATNDLVKTLIGKKPRFCRPPGGQLNTEVIAGAALEGLTTVLWNDDPGDYANPGEDVLIRRTLQQLKPGAIILLHDGSQQMLDLLPSFLQGLKVRGYLIRPLSEIKRKESIQSLKEARSSSAQGSE